MLPLVAPDSVPVSPFFRSSCHWFRLFVFVPLFYYFSCSHSSLRITYAMLYLSHNDDEYHISSTRPLNARVYVASSRNKTRSIN
ncbi:hypothetical protein K435DRAFT_322644 [Dendrothele bispora CBS 962.96]|uniref:Uncharacterized protein n=1 Tax=Dendrothele bispora (strain CBS 962.96) TaxID=1314807 RepID=A0A4S8MKW1_DENBC|nr:hypothetical protein K435DRAFT_322644 [Dendrothele bispora CBS 962.96]